MAPRVIHNTQTAKANSSNPGLISANAWNEDHSLEDVASAADLDADEAALAAHLADTLDAHDASAISLLDAGANYVATEVEAALAEVMDALQAHEADTSDAHDASAVSFSPAAGIAATDVQAAIVEDAGDLAAHLADSADAHAGSAITNTPAGSIAATTVQAAINELDSEKQPLDSDLTAIAALSTTAFGRALLELANAAALGALVDSQFLTPAEGNAAYQPLDGDLTAIAALTTTAYGRALLELANTAAFTALANAFVGDSGAGGTKGHVPAPAAGDAAAGKFLKSDGVWAVPAGGGDVTAAANIGADRLVRGDDGAKGVQESVVIVADTTGALSRAGDGGIPVQGTNTNDDAVAGDKGEYRSATLLAGSATSLVSGTAKTVTFLDDLPAGDWMIHGAVHFSQPTTATSENGGISLTTNTLDTAPDRFVGNARNNAGELPAGATAQSCVVGPTRVSLAAPADVFLIARSGFTGSRTAYGHISAWRIR